MKFYTLVDCSDYYCIAAEYDNFDAAADAADNLAANGEIAGVAIKYSDGMEIVYNAG